MKFDGRLKRHYFVNHNAKTTQWEDPRQLESKTPHKLDSKTPPKLDSELCNRISAQYPNKVVHYKSGKVVGVYDKEADVPHVVPASGRATADEFVLNTRPVWIRAPRSWA